MALCCELEGLPLEPLDLGREDVAAAAHRLNHCRRLPVVFKLAPKSADLDVNGTIARPGLAVSGEMEQPVAGQHLAGVIYERREKIEFAGGQLDFSARWREQLPARNIEGPSERIGPSNRAGKYAEAVNSSLTGLGELLRDLDRIREVLFGNEYVAAFRPRRFREWRHIIAKEGGIVQVAPRARTCPMPIWIP